MNRRLKIHFFVQFVHTQGTYFRFHNLARALAELGHEIEIFGCDHDRRTKVRTERRDGIPYHICPTVGLSRLFNPVANPFDALRRGLIKPRFCDVAHLFQPFLNAALAWRLSRAKTHFYDWDDLWTGGYWSSPPTGLRARYESKVAAFLEKNLPRRADKTTTCSKYLATQAKKESGQPATVVGNGVWPRKFVGKREAREALGLRVDAQYVGFMGRTCDEINWCFDGLREVVQTHPQLRFAICGAPESVLANVDSVLRKRIDYLGQLTPQGAESFSSSLDVGLLPLQDNLFNRSRFPIKLAEYLAAGTPVLCSSVGECAEIARGQSGIIEAGSSREEWLLAFRSAVQSLAAQKLPMLNSSILADTFSWTRLGRILEDEYRYVLGRKK